MKFSTSLSRFTWGRLFCALCGLLMGVCATSVSQAQFKFREPPNRRDPQAIGEREGTFIWQQFLWNRAMGTFHLAGTVVFRPAQGPSKSFKLDLNGDWVPDSEHTRIRLGDAGGELLERELLVKGGDQLYIGDTECPHAFKPLDVDLADESLLPELPLTYSDLLMPFLHWEDVTYLGPDRYLGRPAHRFVLRSKKADASSGKVIVTLDEDYAAMLKAEVYSTDDVVVKRIRVGGFKQFGSQWMFSELYWDHRTLRQSLRLSVEEFSFEN